MKAQIVSFHCVLKNKLGKVLSSTFNNGVITVTGGPGVVLQGLAEGLQNLRKGEKRKIMLSAEKAYGFYDPQKVVQCMREELPDHLTLRHGDHVFLSSDDGVGRNLRVIEISGDRFTLDGNHPLAGQDLIFEIEATQARDATADEMSANSEDTSGLH